MSRNRRGFTLTELLVVVGIIIILMGILIVSVEGLYSLAMRVKCQHNMEQIGAACLMYASAQHGAWMGSWDFTNNRPWYQTLAATGYMDNSQAMACPISDVPATQGSGQTTPSNNVDTTTVQSSINDALRYLKTQQANSCWSGRSMDVYYVGMTALVCLAYTGDAVTVDHAEFGTTLRDGLRWLMNKAYVANDGSFGQFYTDGKYFNYAQGIGVLAMCDALKLMPNLALPMDNGTTKTVREIAQRTFNYLVNTQLYWHGGFPYRGGSWIEHDPNVNGDTSISGWCWQAIHMAKDMGLDPSPKTWSEIDSLNDTFLRNAVPYDGTPGNGSLWPASPYWYHAPNNGAYFYYADWRVTYHGSGSPTSQERISSLSLADRLLKGYKLDGTKPLGSIERDGYEQYQYITYNSKHTRNVQGTNGTPDYYFIYYFSLAQNALRGSDWQSWAQLLADKLPNTWQTKTGSQKGMFSAQGTPFPDGANVYPTALAAMVLETTIADTLVGTRWTHTSSPGSYSYGYNNLIADDTYRNRKAAGDTILLMDYFRASIAASDPVEYIAPRHGNKANVMFFDGRVEQMTDDQLTTNSTETPPTKIWKKGWLTLDPGD